MIQHQDVRPGATSAPPRNYGIALAVISTLFFMWGFVTVLNDILIPHLKAIFNLNYARSTFVQFIFFLGYFIFALPSSRIIAALGYQNSITLGLCVMGIGALIFVPAAMIPSYAVFLVAFFVLASGMTILQVAANPYAAALGPPDKASSRLNLAQALNSLGTTIGPAIGGFLILSSKTGVGAGLTPAQLQARQIMEASSVKMPYIAIAILLFVLAFVLSRFHFPVITQIEDADHHVHGAVGSIWHYRHLVLGAVGIFVYVGAEVAIGSLLVSYLTQPYIAALSPVVAARYLSLYWGGLMVGRLAGSAIMRKIQPGMVLGCAAMIACALVVITILTTGHVAMWSVILVGLFNSIMFPTIFTLGIDGLGKLTGKGSGLLIMAIVGGAVIPFAMGALADVIGLHLSFILPALCYLYIMYYGWRGSRHKALAVA
jgi:FHS family L-fucose permease-like MFS transporter